MRFAVDAMGGDFAPQEIVKGALLAAPSLNNNYISLVGDQKAIEGCIDKLPDNVEIIHTNQIIGMDESPVGAIRNKPDSSLVKCFRLVSEKKADALISAGNTGAVVAGATIFWGFLQGVRRAGIAIPLPTEKGVSYLIDVGANINCHPINLLQYGIMASVYARYVRKIESPRVGLLNIGEEDSKGNLLVQETLSLMKKAPINFAGNLEGNNIFKGNCDVIVCEGFVGNVILKVAEGSGEFFASRLFSSLMKLKDNPTLSGQFDSLKTALENLKKQLDYSEYGGAMLLGVNGIGIISHGRSNAKAICNAIKVADEMYKHQINDNIVKELHKTKLTWMDLLKSWKTHR
ncbi:MAG: phosphate acyltransferase PlsX [Planctomycetota bacterium]|nr:phosphate acyltransferase PlsX [Planctomycetota bacterium]MDI6786841.1 phosphate acyltransferase PlsX [Planctomycetota bacterium]